MVTNYERSKSEWPWRELHWITDGHEELLGEWLPDEDEEVYPTDKMHGMVSLLPIYLSTKLIEHEPEATKTLIHGDLLDRVPMFASRSITYERIWNNQASSIDKQGEDLKVNYVNLFHLFGPIYVQELESPLRYNLAALLDLIKTFNGEEEDWSGRLIPRDSKQAFRSLLNEVEQQIQHKIPEDQRQELLLAFQYLSFDKTNSDFLEEVVGFRLSPHPTVTDLRNSIAHSDYEVRQSSNEDLDYEVVFYPKKMSSDIFIVPLRMILNIIHETMTIMAYLSRGMTITLSDIATEHDKESKARRITEAVSFEGYPRHRGLVDRIENSIQNQLDEKVGTVEEFRQAKEFISENLDASNSEVIENTHLNDEQEVQNLRKNIVQEHQNEDE